MTRRVLFGAALRAVVMGCAMSGLSGGVLAQGTRAATKSQQDIAALTAANAAWLGAYAAHDSATVGRLLADDFAGVVVALDGTTVRLSKREIVTGVADTSVVYDPVAFEIAHIVVTGDVAVVSGRSVFRGRRNGQPFETHSRYADVFARREGRWHAVSMHMVRTALPTSSTRPAP